MAISTPPSLVISLGVAALIVWRLYARIRRLVVRQHLSNVRSWIAVCVFSVLIAVLSIVSLASARNELALVAGIALGTGLGFYGLRLTKFEQTPLGLFYTPNAYLGVALSLLFLGRIAYRAAQVYSSTESLGGRPTDFARSPLTLLIFGVLAGYYVTYAVGLLRWHARVKLSDASVSPL